MQENTNLSSNNLIITPKPEIALSKLQKLFNTLIQKIEKLKIEKIEAKKQIELINVRVMKDLAPLSNKLIDKKVELVYLFDRHYSDVFFKKKELEKLSNFIKGQSFILINQNSRNELVDIYNRHSENEMVEVSEEEMDKDSLNEMKQMYEELLGIEFEADADLDTEEKLNAYVEDKMLNGFDNFSTKNNRKQTAKQIQKEEKEKEEEKNINKIARAIYTDLVKIFHPDREQDETEKEKKTSVMHQITEAYEKNDLFKLLQLKLEHLSGVNDKLILAEEQLKYYNKILKQQVNDLEQEVWAVKMHPQFDSFSGPQNIMDKKFATEIKFLKSNVKEIESDLKVLLDKQNMRIFIKNWL